MIIISNTTPLNYLTLIGEIKILPQLFGALIIPPAVHAELLHPDAPDPVRAWANNLPPWIEIQPIATANPSLSQWLDPGETEAILLAQAIQADLVLLDDLRAREIAQSHGLAVTGTF